MNQSEVTFTLRLTQEELVLLIELMGGRSLPGLGPYLFGELPEEHIALLNASAHRALMARRSLGLPSDNLPLHQDREV